jgi:hypothetical protein
MGIYSSRVGDDAAACDLRLEVEGLLLQCWRSSFQTKLFAGCLSNKGDCNMEAFLGISGIPGV